MEIRRINDDTIKVLVSNSDLSERGITVLDLLGKRDQIKDFFYDILKEVDTKHQFIDDKSVVFQVLPNKNGLELIITKGDKGSHDAIKNTDELMQDQNNLDDDKNIDLDNHHWDSEGTSDHYDSSTQQYVIKLDHFEDFISISKVLKINNGTSDLYKYKGKYYLHLTFFLNVDGTSSDDIKDKLAFAYEYGDHTNVTSDILLEYGKRIMDTSALELTRYYFR
ncbi:adapter protein MecA [Philodulcilactobacillus myokoensis]|uniref:Adapter protein MecA n=1 Tax=Philodulcilactobacillus myokoensis TaxID=2929573 RepID=A0A9W6B1F5_9LACO|nr:adaptor protein MecA [Philodulcilactobacillus myokoensis]GLB47036.1 adapter protein MecA [Philodulcilactobacillus myokoensis]